MSANVLVVDDSATVRQQVRTALTQAGLNVIEAVDGADGSNKFLAGGVGRVVTEARNNAILKYSHETLPSLQFQDPVAQGLRRAEHDVKKLMSLMENRKVVDDSLADIKEDVGHDGTEQQEAGEVMLF